jgi:hypothetical protein
MTEDLLRQMQTMAGHAERRATVNGAQLGAQAARSIVPVDLGRRNALRLA